MFSESELNQAVNTHREKLILVIKALEALAPENFSESIAQQNIERYFALIENGTVFNKNELLNYFRVKDMACLLRTVLTCGFCNVFYSTLRSVGIPTTLRCYLDDIVPLWWESHYKKHSLDMAYPVYHPSKGSISAYTCDMSAKWLTSADAVDADLNPSEMKEYCDHIEYCENRYELVQCTADYFRHLLAEHCDPQ